MCKINAKLLSTATTIAIASFAVTGCQTYEQKSGERMQAWKDERVIAAVSISAHDAKKNLEGKDAILYHLEHANITRVAASSGAGSLTENDPILGKRVKEHNEAKAKLEKARLKKEVAIAKAERKGDAEALAEARAIDPEAGIIIEDLPKVRHSYLVEALGTFEAAEEQFQKYDEEAAISVSENVVSTLTNQANRPYTGRSYDRILTNTYKSMIYMLLGDFESAHVELNRALNRQREAVANNAKRIEKSIEEAELAKSGELEGEDGKKAGSYDIDSAQEDANVIGLNAGVETALEGRIKAYENYVNPYNVLLEGIFYMHVKNQLGDSERARKSFERLAAMVPENESVALDYADAENNTPQQNITYVIFETGLAPYRSQTRVDIPTFIVTSNLSYVGAAFPTIHFIDDYHSSLAFKADETTYHTQIVSSMDSVVGQAFKNEWPSILTRTLISTATKAILDAAIQNAAEQSFGDTGKFLAMVATAATQASVNIADTRTWRTLPKEFQYVRIENPESGKLIFQENIEGITTEESYELEPNAVNVVFVRSVRSDGQLFIDGFNF